MSTGDGLTLLAGAALLIFGIHEGAAVVACLGGFLIGWAFAGR